MARIEPRVALELVLAADSYVAAAFGLAGAVIGGLIAGGVNYMIARQTREEAKRSWIRNTRREVYDRFLTRAQDLQATCQIHKDGDGDETSRDAVERAFNDFFHVYAVIQTIESLPRFANPSSNARRPSCESLAGSRVGEIQTRKRDRARK